MNLRAFLRDMCKKCRTDVGPVNVVINSEDEWCKHLSTRKYPYNPSEVVEKCKASLPDTIKRHMCITESFSGTKKNSLSKLTSSLQVLLAEATMVSVGLSKNIGRVDASQRELEETKLELEKTHELYLKMIEENEELYRAEKTKALKEFKSETLENLSNLAQELKSNILLRTQVVGGPFNTCKVDLDVLFDVDMSKLANITPIDGIDNNEVVGRGENEIPSDHEEADNVL
ncbi:hypothetical protein GOBAR_AA01109 [Gossypium barbadense]|uniref:Uncharacterized protein n=1 Tax=Gossypium barbadense TaxID=3634 RepID=A0A2P5YV33_GOSBA|nr:hypothetical protein GOBAR_AA01109 [Gossypium barbadense]